jgi:inhibitor of cysteine peptidase
MSVVVLNQADNGQLIELNRGQLLSISLTENPTTGYRWEVDKPNAACRDGNEILIFESSSFATTLNAGMGREGERTFIFKAVNVGKIQLQMKLWQSWEGSNPVIEHYSLTVRVY